MTWESISADLLALRQCARAPLFTLLTAASLALGIGANSAIFSVAYAVLSGRFLRRSGALVAIWE